MSSKRIIKYMPIVAILIIAVFLRTYNLKQNVNYSDEQGKFLLETYQIWMNKEVKLIGPPTSFEYQGRKFFQGPVMYYLLIPELLIFNWHPLATSGFIISLNLFSILLVYLSVRKSFGVIGARLSAFLYAIFPVAVYYSKFVWNPNFLPLIGSLILAFLTELITLSWKAKVLMIGFLLGLGLQFHFQTTLLVAAILIYLLINTNKKLSTFFITIFGFLIGYLPIVLFEFRNNFYNLRTIWFVFKNGGFTTKNTLPKYYFLIFLPFLFYFLGKIPNIVNKYKKAVTWSIIVIAVILFTPSLITILKESPGMPPKWRFIYAQKAANIIVEQNLENINVANIVTPGTRAYGQRYLLTIRQQTIMDIDEYPDSEHLFVISNKNKQETAAYPVWEIQSFEGSITQSWLLDNSGIFKLFLLSK